MAEPAAPMTERPLNFIEQIVEQDIASGAWGVWSAQDAGSGPAAAERVGKPRVHTRFPPEPNGYLHVGHAKAICVNHGLAKRYGGKFNLRFDDTNPAKEDQEYVDSIIRDVKWLGADFDPATGVAGGGLFYASHYFGQMYDFAVELIKKGKAYDYKAGDVIERNQAQLELFEVSRCPWKEESGRYRLRDEWVSLKDSFIQTDC
jgi:glutaminyl-tRNA synthetase